MVFWAERNPIRGVGGPDSRFYFVAMGVCFYAMRAGVPLLGNTRVDNLLQQWDRDLLGETPAVAWEYGCIPGWKTWQWRVICFSLLPACWAGHYCIRDIPMYASASSIVHHVWTRVHGYTRVPGRRSASLDDLFTRPSMDHGSWT